jgi:hypothetical protein
MNTSATRTIGSARPRRSSKSTRTRFADQLAAELATLKAYLQGEAAFVTVLRPWRKEADTQSATARGSALH